MTGEQLYERYAAVAEDENVDVDTWGDLMPEDRTVWKRLAKQLHVAEDCS